jgi:hypothetical protein
MRKKTVVFDFDGVVHSYKSGWKGATIISDEPIEGIRDVIKDLKQDYKIVIVSTRCFQEGGIDAIREWLEKHNIEVDDVLGEKPPAMVYVDDRAICFAGKTDGLATQIRGFKNWIEIKQEKDKIRLESLEAYKNIKIGDKLEIHYPSQVFNGKVIEKHDNGDFDAEVGDFDDVYFNVEKILSGTSRLLAIYLCI